MIYRIYFVEEFFDFPLVVSSHKVQSSNNLLQQLSNTDTTTKTAITNLKPWINIDTSYT